MLPLENLGCQRQYQELAELMKSRDTELYRPSLLTTCTYMRHLQGSEGPKSIEDPCRQRCEVREFFEEPSGRSGEGPKKRYLRLKRYFAVTREMWI